MKRSYFVSLFAVVFSCWAIQVGCGSDEPGQSGAPAGNGNGPGPEEKITCENLNYQNAKGIGGTVFAVPGNLEWEFDIPSNSGNVFFVIKFDCKAISVSAHLRIYNPYGAIIWERGINVGDSDVVCMQQEDTIQGRYTIGLSGDSPSGFILYFGGTVFISVFNEKGELIVP